MSNRYGLEPGDHVYVTGNRPDLIPVKGYVTALGDDQFEVLLESRPELLNARRVVPVNWSDVGDLTRTPASNTVIRQYRGRQQRDANEDFQAEVSLFARMGYVPTTQSWAQGQWGIGAWVFAVILLFALIGILVFLYMLIVKPDGTLTVTYARTDAVPVPVQAAQPAQNLDLRARLERLELAWKDSLITQEEYDLKRAELIKEF